MSDREVSTDLGPDDPERFARAALSFVADPGDRRMHDLVARESAAEVWTTLSTSQRETLWPSRARQVDPLTVMSRARQAHLRFLIPGDAEWPADLADLTVRTASCAPLGLWVSGPGGLADLSSRAVAIVGSRSSTSYGDWVAADLSAELVAMAPPWTVVSGGAYGIDAAAHRGALAAHGPTLAVLAGGVDRMYPRGNAGLLAQVRDRYLVLSESGLGAAPRKRDFLARNRLIAALSCGTIVVEGGARSGATNTAHWAHELGRTVMAVPGSITSAQSVTPHRLIRDGQASLVADASDITRLVAPLGTQPELDLLGPPTWFDSLDPVSKAVREALPAHGSLTVSEIATRSGHPVRSCLQALAQLADQGLVAAGSAGRWALSRPGRTVER